MLRDRWWPLPGVLAVVGTLSLVALTQGWVRGNPVVLPRAVEIRVPAQRSHDVSATTDPSPAEATVVSPALPVVREKSTSLVVPSTRAPIQSAPSPVPLETAPVNASPTDDGNPLATSTTTTSTTLGPSNPTQTRAATTTTTQPPVTTTTDDGVLDH